MYVYKRSLSPDGIVFALELHIKPYHFLHTHFVPLNMHTDFVKLHLIKLINANIQYYC